MPRNLPALASAVVTLALAGCDNVGRAFDPVLNPPNNGPANTSKVQVPPAGGDPRDGRPAVRAAFPKGSGWPNTVPIVVEFSETMNQASVLPTSPTGSDGKIVLRASGTSVALPTFYDFLAGGRLLVMRPLTTLTAPAGASFDIVQLPGILDADGLGFTGTSEVILATFQVDSAASEDGKIVATYPRDNSRDVARDSDFLMVLSRPPNPATLLSQANFLVRTAAGAAVAGGVTAPVSVAAIPDPRIVLFKPTAPTGYEPDTQMELVVTQGITFGTSGVLQFSGRTPVMRFTTSAVPRPQSVTVANPVAGFDDQVNRSNLATLQLAVQVPADAAAGDHVIGRIYGLDKNTQTTGDLAFVTRDVTLPAAGVQTATLDFSGQLGTLTHIRFEEGSLTFTAQLQRGTAHSGLIHGSAVTAIDTVAPSLLSIGPTIGSNGTDLFTELDHLVVFGRASEQLGDVRLTVGGAPVSLFASRSDGTFLSAPLLLSRSTTAVGYSLAIFDRAGNEAAAPATGNLFQRGMIRDDGTAGALTVEVYDEATLRPLAGVTVLVDPGAPVIPADANRATATTGADGRASFTGLPTGNHTITAIADGFDLITLYDSAVGFASLPLRPTSPGAARATLAGVVTFEGVTPPVPAGTTGIIGSNLIDDSAIVSISTLSSAANLIPPTAIRPNRLHMLTGFGGAFEPTSTPSFEFEACNLCGSDLTSPSPPSAPPAAGSTATVALATIRDARVSPLSLLTVNFNQSLSFQPNNLVGPPIVRFLCALDGFVGQSLVGLGFGTGQPSSLSVTGSFSAAMLDTLEPFSPRAWVMTQAVDQTGQICRIRALVDRNTSNAAQLLDPQWIPVLQPPAGPSTGSPMVTVFDVLDAPAVSTAFGVPVLGAMDVVARDAAGRQWRMIAEDFDDRVTPSTTNDYQFPDPGSATGLAAGTWSIFATARLFRAENGAAVGNQMLADRMREEVSFARGAPTSFTVN